MANLIKYQASVAGWEAALSIGLDGLTDGSIATTSAFTNSSDLLMGMDVSGRLASITPGTGGYCEVHIGYLQDDGSTYPDIFLGGPTLLFASALKTGASVKNLFRDGLQISPGDFKLSFLNKAGASLAGSGNILKIRRYAINANA
jgi:hypothetical protein